MKILFLTARFPFPPLKGDQVRGYHQLRLLGQQHAITLLSFADRHLSDEGRRQIESFGVSVQTVPIGRAAMVAGLLRGALTAYPLQTLLYRTALMRRAVGAVLERQSFDLGHVQLARMATYLQHRHDLPRVVDLIDALSLNMERRYRSDRSPLRLAALLEWRRLQRYERALCADYNRVIVVSSVDRDAIGPFPGLHVIPIGVDLARFPLVRERRAQQTLVFSGNMGYFPNVNAAEWLVREVLPRIQAAMPQVRVQIVGANPHPRVRALAREGIVEVTGRVPDLHSYLARATVAVVPMQAGSGMQFKVIEAMASGAPVVVTPFALGGIAAADGEDLLVGSTPQQFATQVLRLLNDADLRDRLAARGRALVEERYTWERTVEALEAVYRLAVDAPAQS